MEFNSHSVVTHRDADNHEGWPVCTDLDPALPLVPSLKWEEMGCYARLRCTGHLSYVPDEFYERQARLRLESLEWMYARSIVVGRPILHYERARRLREAAAEAKHLAQRTLPLREELNDLALRLVRLADAFSVQGEGEEWWLSFEEAALLAAVLHVQERYPAFKMEALTWRSDALRGSALGCLPVRPESLGVHKEWVQAYVDALHSPWCLGHAEAPALGKPSRPKVLKRWRDCFLVYAPEVLMSVYEQAGSVRASVRATPELLDALPVLWDPAGKGPLRDFAAAVEAVALV